MVSDENDSWRGDKDKLEWIQLNESLTIAENVESMGDKIIRKSKENPLVPIGCLATSAALMWGVRSMYVGNRRMSQLMMRSRVVAQGLTFLALTAGILMTTRKKNSSKDLAPVVVHNGQ